MLLKHNILYWNRQEAGSRVFLRTVRDLIRIHRPMIVIILEPRISGARAMGVISQIGLSMSYRVECDGFAGGI